MACLTNALHLQKTRCFSLFILMILSVTSPATSASSDWLSVATGVEYRDISVGYLAPWSHVHVFRISLKKNTLSSILASSFAEKLATAETFARKGNAFLAINGGFFDNQSKPLGLRLTDYKQQNSLKPISWWGIFYIQGKKPHITSYQEFNRNKRMEFAIQSGPRLLIDNSIVSLKPGIAERTALGITKHGKVIILVTENAAMSTSQLAKLLKSPPLFCTDALNLDGGGSTQMYMNMNGMLKKVYGFTGVSDAVLLKPR